MLKKGIKNNLIFLASHLGPVSFYLLDCHRISTLPLLRINCLKKEGKIENCIFERQFIYYFIVKMHYPLFKGLKDYDYYEFMTDFLTCLVMQIMHKIGNGLRLRFGCFFFKQDNKSCNNFSQEQEGYKKCSVFLANELKETFKGTAGKL